MTYILFIVEYVLFGRKSVLNNSERQKENWVKKEGGHSVMYAIIINGISPLSGWLYCTIIPISEEKSMCF